MPKNLKYLNRMELIEIIYEMKKNEERLQAQVDELQQQVASKTVKLEKAGSIADATIALHDVFETAQVAADAYLKSIEQIKNETEAVLIQNKKEYDEIIAEARVKAAAMLQEARDEISRMKQEIEPIAETVKTAEE